MAHVLSVRQSWLVAGSVLMGAKRSATGTLIMAEIDDLRDQLIETRIELEKVKLRATTTLSGAEFLTLIMLAPVVAAFVILGIIIVWSTTQNPASVAPHLDIILVAYAIFATPTTAGLAAITGRFSREGNKE